MIRTAAALLLLFATLAGCSWFETKKQPLPGERISVLSLDRQLEPDPELAKIAITLPAPVVNPDWPEPGGYPNHAMQHLSLPDKLTRVWRTSTGEGASRYTRVLSQPVVANGRVYAMDGAVEVGAYDAATGDRLWQVDLKPEDERGNSFGGGVAFWNDRLYASTGYAQVFALDPADGKVIWKSGVGAPVRSAPTVSDGRVFAVTVENELAVLAADDGRRLWTHNGIPETASLLGGASPAVEGEVVVAAYSSGELYALTVETGRPVWSDNLASARSVNAVSALADIRGWPVIDRGRVYAASHGGLMAPRQPGEDRQAARTASSDRASIWLTVWAAVMREVSSHSPNAVILARISASRWLHRSNTCLFLVLSRSRITSLSGRAVQTAKACTAAHRDSRREHPATRQHHR